MASYRPHLFRSYPLPTSISERLKPDRQHGAQTQLPDAHTRHGVEQDMKPRIACDTLEGTCIDGRGGNGGFRPWNLDGGDVEP